MKILFLIPVLALLSTTAVNAQYNKQIKQAETQKLLLNGEQEFTVKTIVEEKQYLEVEADTPTAINQEVKETPVMITETVLIDNDNDQDFEKKVVFHYLKKDNAAVEYTPTKDGVILTQSADEQSLLTTEGDYILDTTAYQDLVIQVEDLK